MHLEVAKMNLSQTFADQVCEQIGRNLAIRTTRRSLMAKGCRFFFALMGVKVLSASPGDIGFFLNQARAATKTDPACTSPQYTGIHGKPCALCAAGTGGTDNTCPPRGTK